jgi:hypothetical protein
MSHFKAARMAACLAVLVAVLVGGVSGASASKASIKATLRSFSGKIDVAEGNTLSAIGAYKTNHAAAPVDMAIGKSVTVLQELKRKIAAQSAGSPKIKTAKSKLLKGIGAVIVSYEHLGTAFQEHGSDPQAAETEAKAALTKLKGASKQLKEAAALLG